MSHPLAKDTPSERESWLRRFQSVRAATAVLTQDLTPEDQTIQTVADVSPTKWHLAHTSWFFETFVLEPFAADFKTFDPHFGYLFNSYYEAVGARYPRPQRGLISRPGVAAIMAYRAHVDAAMENLIARARPQDWPKILDLLELGLHHEQQHQELILMDIKHVFSVNPLQPAYAEAASRQSGTVPPLTWSAFPGGLYETGHDGETFAFDNEGPRHKVWLEPFALANRTVTQGEYLTFMHDGGYQRPEFWLSDGWTQILSAGWTAPHYWSRNGDGEWTIFTLTGPRPLNAGEPVCHVSYYEADAYARWAGKRLASEAEWEIAVGLNTDRDAMDGNFADSKLFHPEAAQSGAGMQQMFGNVWEWTQSPYTPYPRYRPPAGAVGEYNGKFMSGQMVLRGGSAVTPSGHVRATYRNFFPPSYRLVFSGIRLADNV